MEKRHLAPEISLWNSTQKNGNCIWIGGKKMMKAKEKTLEIQTAMEKEFNQEQEANDQLLILDKT